MPDPRYPFIYIASLMRTGSTLISEALTELPHAFIFREPHIGKNTFRYKPDDVERFRQYGFDLEAFLKYRLVFAFFQRRLRFLGYRQDYMVRVFKYRLIPQMAGTAKQFGVKEIDNRGWQNYHRHFPDMKVILTARDPRDIYLSLRRVGRWRREQNPDLVAQAQRVFDLMPEYVGYWGYQQT